MISIDRFVFVGYFFELRKNISLYLFSFTYSKLLINSIFLSAIIIRGLLAWALASRILNIKDKKAIIFLFIPILTTEAVIRDILFGIENVTRVIEETNNLGVYTIFIRLTTFPKMLVIEHIYRSGIVNNPVALGLINTLGFVLGRIYDTFLCELWRVGLLVYLKRRGLIG
jgi:hypothetical protein